MKNELMNSKKEVVKNKLKAVCKKHWQQYKYKCILIVGSILLIFGTCALVLRKPEAKEPVIDHKTATVAFNNVNKVEVYNKEYADMIDVSYKGKVLTNACKVKYKALVSVVYDLKDYTGIVDEKKQTITFKMPASTLDIVDINYDIVDYTKGREDGKSSSYIYKAIDQHVENKASKDEGLSQEGQASFQTFMKKQIQEHFKAYQSYRVVFQ